MTTIQHHRSLGATVLATLVLAAGCAATAPPRQGAAPPHEVPDARRATARAAVPGVEPGTDLEAAAGAPVDARRSAWTFWSAPYFWLFASDGDVGVRDRKVPVSTSLGDTWDLVRDHLEPSFAGHFEAQHDDVSILLDVNHVHVAGDQGFTLPGPSGPGSLDGRLDVDVRLTFVELAAAVRTARIGGLVERSGTIDLLGGVRWSSLDVDTDFRVSGQRVTIDRDLDGRSDWFDPFVGLRSNVPLGESVDLRLRGDVGGGIGDGSDLAWSVLTGLQWRVSDQVDVFVGYRWYDFDRDSGGRDTQMRLSGPGLGAVIRF